MCEELEKRSEIDRPPQEIEQAAHMNSQYKSPVNGGCMNAIRIRALLTQGSTHARIGAYARADTNLPAHAQTYTRTQPHTTAHEHT